MVTYANENFDGNDFALDSGACQLGSAPDAAILGRSSLAAGV